MNNKTSSIPQMYYIWVDTQFTHEEPCGFVEAQWIQTVATPDRAWGINVVFRDGGMCYRNIPPHAISFIENNKEHWSINKAQLWNCYGYQYEHLQCEHLDQARCIVNICNKQIAGTYLFQTGFIGDSYSLCPEQDKTFFWIRLDNGRLTVQPTNRVRFHDASFQLPSATPARLKLQSEIYRCHQ
jgi:hypothetical protein